MSSAAGAARAGMLVLALASGAAQAAGEVEPAAAPEASATASAMVYALAEQENFALAVGALNCGPRRLEARCHYEAPDSGSLFVGCKWAGADEMHALLQTIITRLMKLLTRRGVLVEDTGQTYLAENYAASGRNVGLGARACAVLNVACV
jgi:hypothetical protein